MVEIPATHIAARWTWHARDMALTNMRLHNYRPEISGNKLLQHIRLHGKALEVARKGNQDFGAYEIGMKYLHLAVDEINKYIEVQQDGVCSQGVNSENYILDGNEANSES